MENRKHKEYIEIGLATLGLIGVSFLAFTLEQKKWIKERDDYTCQCNDPNHHGHLNVHHIIPKSILETQGVDADTPTNGITICEAHHAEIHKENNPQFETKYGHVHWGPQYLSELATKAVENTRLMFIRGTIFPK